MADVPKDRPLTFTLNGKPYTLSYDQVVEKAAGWTGQTRVDKYFVRIRGKRFPIKPLLAHAIGQPPAEFNSHQAYGILERLGFNIEVTES